MARSAHTEPDRDPSATGAHAAPARRPGLAALAAASALLAALGSCEVATNLDIRETAFPSEQSIKLEYKTELKVYGETIGLPDVLDSESSWQIFSVYNSEESEEVTLGEVSLEDDTGFTLDTSTLQQSLSPLGSTEFRIKYLPPSPGVVETRLFVPYSVAGRDRSFMVILQGQRNEDTMPITTVLDPADSELDSDGVAYDFGYAAATTVSRTFTIRNDGQETLRIYSVYSSDDAAFKVTDKPAVNTALAQGAEATFTVAFQSSAMETFSTAYVTVSTNATNDSEFLVNLAGGGAELPLTFTGDVGYLLDGHGYDFGWASAAETVAITLSNSGEIPFTIPLDDITIDPVDRYEALTLGSETLAAGQSTSLSVRFTPASDEWSEADLTLTSAAGRSYTLRLTGSGFRQPSDLASPALWLKAESIRSTNVVSAGSVTYVNLLPDVSGNGFDAIANGENRRPVYVESGISGFPALEFSGTTEHMIATPTTGNIVTNASGTTTFVLFRTAGVVDGTRYIVSPQYTSGAESYPRLFWDLWYFNPVGGDYTLNVSTRKAQIRFGVYGYSATRYPGNSDDEPVTTNKVYLASMLYDSARASPEPNMLMWLNGSDAALTYLYSRSTTWTSGTKYGAFGLPVSDGSGNIRTSPAPDADDYCNNAACASSLSDRLTTTYNPTIWRINIGASSTPSYFFTGRIAEIIIYDAPLTEAEIDIVNNYFINKYAITP